MCCGSVDTNGMDTTLQVSAVSHILQSVPNVFPPCPVSASSCRLLLSSMESKLIQRGDYGGIHPIIGNRLFGQLILRLISTFSKAEIGKAEPPVATLKTS